MSCPVWNGYPGCPSCTPEPRMITSPACNGTGEIYYNENGDRISEEEYALLPADEERLKVAKNATGQVA